MVKIFSLLTKCFQIPHDLFCKFKSKFKNLQLHQNFQFKINFKIIINLSLVIWFCMLVKFVTCCWRSSTLVHFEIYISDSNVFWIHHKNNFSHLHNILSHLLDILLNNCTNNRIIILFQNNVTSIIGIMISLVKLYCPMFT